MLAGLQPSLFRQVWGPSSFCLILLYLVRLPHGSAVKNSSAMRKMQVQSLGGEDPLEEGMTTHSSILAGRIAWTEEPGGLWSTGSQSQTRLKRQQQ